MVLRRPVKTSGATVNSVAPKARTSRTIAKPSPRLSVPRGRGACSPICAAKQAPAFSRLSPGLRVSGAAAAGAVGRLARVESSRFRKAGKRLRMDAEGVCRVGVPMGVAEFRIRVGTQISCRALRSSRPYTSYGSVGHGTCFRRRLSARHAGAAPHYVVAELAVVPPKSASLAISIRCLAYHELLHQRWLPGWFRLYFCSFGRLRLVRGASMSCRSPAFLGNLLC